MSLLLSLLSTNSLLCEYLSPFYYFHPFCLFYSNLSFLSSLFILCYHLLFSLTLPYALFQPMPSRNPSLPSCILTPHFLFFMSSLFSLPLSPFSIPNSPWFPPISGSLPTFIAQFPGPCSSNLSLCLFYSPSASKFSLLSQLFLIPGSLLL